jgi:HK97 family phage portal protein
MGILTKAVSYLARGLGLTDPRLYHYFNAGPTHAGETVTVDTAMQLDVCWACVRLIAETIATLPLDVYRRDANGNGVFDKKHPLYRLLHDRPNADMTAVEFWTCTVAAILLWGNSYAAISRRDDDPNSDTPSLPGPDNPIIAITPMRPDRVIVRRETDGSLRYTYSWMGYTTQLQESQVLHVKGFSLDGMVGISPISQARQSLSSSMAAEKSAGSVFRNGLRPSMVMKAKTYLTDAQRDQAKKIIERYSGAMNAGSVPLLEGDWALDTISMKPEDAQLLQTRGFNVETICRWFGVAPAMIGHTEKSTAWGTGLEQMNLWFLMYCLRPHLERIEQAIAKSLMTVEEQLVNYAEFNVDGILRADSTMRAALYRTMISFGLSTPNELRALENLPPDPHGDDLLVMSNMIPIALLGEFVRGKQPAPLDPNYKPGQAGDPAGGANDGGQSGPEVGKSALGPFGIPPTPSGPLKYSPDQPRDAGGRFAPGGDGSRTSAIHAAKENHRAAVAWFRDNISAAASAIAGSAKVKHAAIETVSFLVQSALSHGTGVLAHHGVPVPDIQGLDASTWKLNETLVEHTVEHFATIAAITNGQARDAVRSGVNKLMDMRQAQINARLGRKADEQQPEPDPVLQVLQAILDALDRLDAKDAAKN